jgi:hypothetical protein
MEVAVSSIVQSASGLRTSAQSVVTVVPSNAPATSQPQPVEVDTRVTAGGTVTIPIPVTGVDSDGEDVTVTGVTSPPALGRILAVTADSITYQAYPSMSGGVFTGGTDRFTYEVTSQLGASAQAVVRVGVTPPAQAQAPVAVDHFATGAPGALVAVDLLADADVSPGDQVKVLPLSQTNASGTGGATLGGADQSVLLARAPSGSASTTLAYGITDGTSTPSIAHVTIRAVAKYAQAPIATDYFPSLPNSTARSVAVDVLIRDSDPGSTRPDLRLVSSSVRGVSVAAADLRIPVTANPRAVPYEISSVTTGATAIGVVYVPGTSTALQAIPGKEIKVPKGGHATVNLTNYVTDAGRPFRLTSAASASASASPASGVLTSVVGADQVTVAGVGSYQGPGSLTVQVATSTGANGASQPVELSIPVQVGNPTPVVS